MSLLCTQARGCVDAIVADYGTVNFERLRQFIRDNVVDSRVGVLVARVDEVERFIKREYGDHVKQVSRFLLCSVWRLQRGVCLSDGGDGMCMRVLCSSAVFLRA